MESRNQSSFLQTATQVLIVVVILATGGSSFHWYWFAGLGTIFVLLGISRGYARTNDREVGQDDPPEWPDPYETSPFTHVYRGCFWASISSIGISLAVGVGALSTGAETSLTSACRCFIFAELYLLLLWGSKALSYRISKWLLEQDLRHHRGMYGG